MKNIQIIHLGLGHVGKRVMEMILKNRLKLQKDFGINLNYVAVFNSKGGYYNPKGLGMSDIGKIQAKLIPDDVIKHAHKPFIVIDTTASSEIFPVLEQALEKGGYAVLSNKKPLSSGFKIFQNLQKLAQGRLFYEATVGAGLPVIYTLNYLLKAGDEISEIEGCFSGTLGFITSSLEDGMSYSKAIEKARELGFTEPDPRDDLSGMDIARKALILSRLLGHKLEIKDIECTPFYDTSLANLSIPNFLKETKSFDKKYAELFSKALKNNMTYRYVATVNKSGINIGLKQIPLSSPIGNLKGPDNIVIFRTKYYNKNPLVIQGPGAGIDVTSAGVFGDILQIINQIK